MSATSPNKVADQILESYGHEEPHRELKSACPGVDACSQYGHCLIRNPSRHYRKIKIDNKGVIIHYPVTSVALLRPAAKLALLRVTQTLEGDTVCP